LRRRVTWERGQKKKLKESVSTHEKPWHVPRLKSAARREGYWGGLRKHPQGFCFTGRGAKSVLRTKNMTENCLDGTEGGGGFGQKLIPEQEWGKRVKSHCVGGGDQSRCHYICGSFRRNGNVRFTELQKTRSVPKGSKRGGVTESG